MSRKGASKVSVATVAVLAVLITACIIAGISILFRIAVKQDQKLKSDLIKSLDHWEELQHRCEEAEERIWKMYQLHRIDRTLYEECAPGPFSLWPLPLIENHEARIKALERRQNSD